LEAGEATEVEVARIERDEQAGLSDLGLRLAETKQLTSALQAEIVPAQLTRLSQLAAAKPLELAVFWGVASQGRHHGLGCHCDAGTPSEVILGGGWSGKLILSR
jgi:hypothetical protein